MRELLKGATLVFIVSITLGACGGGGEAAPDVTTLDTGFKQVEAIDMTFQWKIEGDTMEAILISPEFGWVGVGFDPQSFMKDANFILGFVEDGATSIADHWGDTQISHQADSEAGGVDNVTLIEGREDENGTMLHFTIPLDSGDEYDQPLVGGQTHTILLAYSSEDDYTTQHKDTEMEVFDIEL